jgi:hypothetical protein
MVINSHDVAAGWFVYQLERGRNCMVTASENLNEDFYDTLFAGSPHGHDFYAMFGAGGGEHLYCGCHHNRGVSNLYYCYYMEECSYCLGCIGLKNKSYCILNKQYTKEERYQKVDEIFAAMEQK